MFFAQLSMFTSWYHTYPAPPNTHTDTPTHTPPHTHQWLVCLLLYMHIQARQFRCRSDYIRGYGSTVMGLSYLHGCSSWIRVHDSCRGSVSNSYWSFEHGEFKCSPKALCIVWTHNPFMTSLLQQIHGCDIHWT